MDVFEFNAYGLLKELLNRGDFLVFTEFFFDFTHGEPEGLDAVGAGAFGKKLFTLDALADAGAIEIFHLGGVVDFLVALTNGGTVGAVLRFLIIRLDEQHLLINVFGNREPAGFEVTRCVGEQFAYALALEFVGTQGRGLRAGLDGFRIECLKLGHGSGVDTGKAGAQLGVALLKEGTGIFKSGVERERAVKRAFRFTIETVLVELHATLKVIFSGAARCFFRCRGFRGRGCLRRWSRRGVNYHIGSGLRRSQGRPFKGLRLHGWFLCMTGWREHHEGT